MRSPTSLNPLARMLRSARQTYREFPTQFWILLLGAFIDRLGGALLFPFFTLYITRKFGVGMTQVGVLFALFSLSTALGSFLGGALTDRLGRKGMLIFGLVTSALSSLAMGLVESFQLFFGVTLLVGILSNAAGPAQGALVADLLPAERRAQGYGILRVVANLAVTIGPLIGGLLAARSYMLLFVTDTVTSLITAVIVFFAIKETLRPRSEGEPQESVAETFGGYGLVLRDVAFVTLMSATILMVTVYMQMNTTLSVFLRDVHGISEQGFSYVLSLNAAMVVLFQFSITRWASRFRPLLVLAAGTLLYAVGFAMYGFVGAFWLFLLAMAIITVGEMLVSPVEQAIVANLAPPAMRGRYMAISGLSWLIPSAIGPLLAGLIIDNGDPRWVWYGSGLLGLVATAAFAFLARQANRARYQTTERRLDIMELVEQGKLSAEDAARRLAGVLHGPWERLASAESGQMARQGSSRRIRIQVNELENNQVKVDMRLPLGLVYTVMEVGGSLSNRLDSQEHQALRSLLVDYLDDDQGSALRRDGIDIAYEDDLPPVQ